MRTASPWRHPVSGILYFRRAVPADLRPAVGRREIKISLDTKDPFEARLRFFRASLECEQLFREARLVSLEGWRPVLEEEVAADQDASEQVGDERAPTVSQTHERWIEERRPAEQTVGEWSAARRRFIEPSRVKRTGIVSVPKLTQGLELQRLSKVLRYRQDRGRSIAVQTFNFEPIIQVNLDRLPSETEEWPVMPLLFSDAIQVLLKGHAHHRFQRAHRFLLETPLRPSRETVDGFDQRPDGTVINHIIDAEPYR